MSKVVRRRRCSQCGKAKENDDYSPLQLRNDEKTRLCLECEQKTGYIKPAYHTTDPVNPSGPSPNQRGPMVSPTAGGRGMTSQTAAAAQAGIHASPPQAVQRQLSPMREKETPASHNGPNVESARSMLCVGCKQARNCFSATMFKANAQQRLCVDCERKFPQGIGKKAQAQYDIGIDCGGTNTDVVLISRDEKDGDKINIVETCKEPTTIDVTTGVVKGVRYVLTAANVNPKMIRFIFLGTTQFMNALVERSTELSRVGVIRLGGVGASSVKPFVTLPGDLQQRVAGDFVIVNGGYDSSGRDYLPLDRGAVADACRRFAEQGITNIVINGMFSGIRHDQESEVEEIVRSEMTAILGQENARRQLFITKSSDVATRDLLLREHAAICNATLRPLALRVISGFHAAFNSELLPLHETKVFLTSNDGTILPLYQAALKPILTLSSGPTNSMVGANLLCKSQGLIPVGVQGSVTFETLAAALPILRRTRHVTNYVYDEYEAPELGRMKERLIVKLGKSPPTEEERRDLKAAGFFSFAPNGEMSFDVFTRFMKESMRSKLAQAELTEIFEILDVGGTKLLVCDIGGTTSDFGIVERSGFPRVSNTTTTQAGVRFNARYPETLSLGLGGGSVIDTKTDPVSHRPQFKIGPGSVGYNLTSNKLGAISFGGPHLTSTDVALALGHTQIHGADSEKAVRCFPRLADAKVCMEQMKSMIEEKIALMKQDDTPLDFVLVGGGSSVFGRESSFAGTKATPLRPQHYEVANAIGAAVARVGADIDELVQEDAFPPTATNSTIERVEIELKRKLCQKCASAGALSDTVVVTDFSVETAPYRGGMYVVRGRALGKMDMSRISVAAAAEHELIEVLKIAPQVEPPSDHGEYQQEDQRPKPMTDTFLSITRPISRPQNIRGGVWSLTPEDVELIAIGCGILGCGGGGNTYQGRMRAISTLISEGKQINVISPRSLNKNRHVVMPVAFVGSPDVLVDMIGSGDELGRALSNNLQLCQRQLQGKEVVLCSAEIGGTNGVEPMICAARKNYYIVDADGMGRAFPLLRHFAGFHSPGALLSPISMAGAKDIDPRTQQSAIAIRETSFDKIEAMIGDALKNKFGQVAALSLPPLSVDNFNPESIVFNSISHAWTLGQIVHNSRCNHDDPVRQLAGALGGKVIFQGTITNKRMIQKKYFSAGILTIRGSGEEMNIDYINENICARYGGNGSGGKPQYVATVPDCISVLDQDSGEAIFCDQYKYGTRVAVVVHPCHAVFKGTGTLSQEVLPKKIDPDLDTEPILLPNSRPEVQSLCDL